MEQFLAELKVLMAKYNVTISSSTSYFSYDKEYLFVAKDACVDMEDVQRETA
jgi:hypothetical protein